MTNGEVFAAQDTNPNVNSVFGTNPDTTTWFQYAPTSSGIYVNGTWNTQATMNTARKHFQSIMLPDGRIFAIGGEFSPTVGNVNAPEIYDPVSNTWTRVADMPSPPTQLATFPSQPPTTPTSQFGKAPIALLPNGDILAGWFNGPQTFVYNVASNTWRSTTAPKLRSDPSFNENWVKLPDGSILSYDIGASVTNNVFQAQRFVPSMDMWVDASNVATLNPPNVLTSPTCFWRRSWSGRFAAGRAGNLVWRERADGDLQSGDGYVGPGAGSADQQWWKCGEYGRAVFSAEQPGGGFAQRQSADRDVADPVWAQRRPDADI